MTVFSGPTEDVRRRTRLFGCRRKHSTLCVFLWPILITHLKYCLYSLESTKVVTRISHLRNYICSRLYNHTANRQLWIVEMRFSWNFSSLAHNLRGIEKTYSFLSSLLSSWVDIHISHIANLLLNRDTIFVVSSSINI